MSKPSYSFGGGDGASAESAFVISTADHLRELAQAVAAGITFGGAHFKLISDIDMEGASWQPIGAADFAVGTVGFAGGFLGGGHTIHNFRCTGSSAGIFGYADGAVIAGLRVGNFSIEGDCDAGAIAAVASGSTFRDCHAGGSISVNGYGKARVGGLVGRASRCTFERCSSGSKISASGAASVGGLVGECAGASRISGCRTARVIYAGSSSSAGGLVGECADSEISSSTSAADVKATNCGAAGGLVGKLDGSRAVSCGSTSDVSSTTDVDGASVGGLVGSSTGDIEKCAAGGSVACRGARAGGMIGSSVAGMVTACACSGDVSGEGVLGGFVGYLNCTNMSRVRIEDCCSSGDVRVSGSASASLAGGFAARIDRDGGSVVIARCYCWGSHHGTQNGFVGANVYGNIMNSFWHKDASTNADKGSSHAVASLTAEEFADEEKFTAEGWNFSGDEPVWCFSAAISPRRPTPSAIPTLRKKERETR